MFSHNPASVLPTTVSSTNTSVFSGTTLNCRQTSDKPPEPLPICRNLAGNSADFRKIHGKTRGESLVGSVEVPECKNNLLSRLGGQYRAAIGDSTKDQTDRERELEALADFNAAWEAIRFGVRAGREW